MATSAAPSLALAEMLPRSGFAAGVMVDQQPLPYTVAAQKSSPVLQRGFLSPKEIEQVPSEALTTTAGPQVEQAYTHIRPDAGCVCRDQRGAFVPTSDWSTTYLHTDGAFQRTLPGLLDRIAALAWRVDLEQGWGLLAGKQYGREVNVRCIEYHHYSAPAGLSQPEHHDTGSLLTVDMMLSSEADFEGGAFRTLEGVGAEPRLVSHQFGRGDAIVFVSHKYHSVAPITRGSRRVLIIEFWEAKACSCAHRCVSPIESRSREACGFSLELAREARLQAGFTDPSQFVQSAAAAEPVVPTSFDFVDMKKDFQEDVCGMLRASSYAALRAPEGWEARLAALLVGQVELGTAVVSCSTLVAEQMLGFASVLPMPSVPAELVQSLHSACSQQRSSGDGTDGLQKALEMLGGGSAGCGLLVHSRSKHIPRQLVPPLHQVLREDLSWAAENAGGEEVGAAFKLDRMLIVSALKQAESGEGSAKKRKLGVEDQWAYNLVHVEDGLYLRRAEWVCQVWFKGSEVDRRVMLGCVAIDALEAVVNQLKHTLG